MGKPLDLIGLKFGKLLVIERDFSKKGNFGRIWKCICDCGEITTASSRALNNNGKKSCGCLAGNRDKSNSYHDMITSKQKERIRNIWRMMKKRCESEIHNGYKYYGGKGIRVCDEWKDFNTFLDWTMQNEYSDKLSLDRIDGEKDYSPHNCRWVTKMEQQNNRSNTIKIPYKGESVSLSELSQKTGIKHSTLYTRYRFGFTPEQIIAPIKSK